MDNKDRIIERIKKMLALSRDAAASEGERDNAMRMAHATLAKYNLSIEEVEAATGKEKEPRIRDHVQFFGRPWARMIAKAVADLLFCHYYYQIPGHTRSATKVMHHYVGRESNVITACELANALVSSVMSERRKRSAELGDPPAFARSFAWGAAQTIRQRVDDIIAGRVPTGGDGKALVLHPLYASEREKNLAKLKELGIVLKKTKSHGHSSRSHMGLVEGAVYGATLSLTPAVTSGRRKQIR